MNTKKLGKKIKQAKELREELEVTIEQFDPDKQDILADVMSGYINGESIEDMTDMLRVDEKTLKELLESIGIEL